MYALYSGSGSGLAKCTLRRYVSITLLSVRNLHCDGQLTLSTGMDVAPVLLPLHRFPEKLASRLEFVQANFLQRWPFEDDSFDLVRIGYAGTAVPEHMWVHMFEEAARVCKPKTGWIECLDYLPALVVPVPGQSNHATVSLQGGTSRNQATTDTAGGKTSMLVKQLSEQAQTMAEVRAKACETMMLNCELDKLPRILNCRGS